MGWNNPAMRWKELERRLSGLPGADDAPVSRRKRALAAARARSSAPPRSRRTPSCTATATSASSTAPARPPSSSRRRCGSACTRSRSPTTTASTALRCWPRPRRRTTLPTVFGAELSLGLTGPQNGVPDPEGSHLLVLARGVEGYHRLAAAMTDAHLRGDEKGRPALRPRRAGRARARPLGGAHRLPQGRGPAGARRRGRGGGGRGARPADVACSGSSTSLVELSPVPVADATNASLAGLAAVHGLDRRRGRQRPPRHPAAAPAGLRDGGRARPAQPGRARRLARPVRLGAPAQRRGDGRGAARRYPGAVARSVSLADELAFDLRKASPRAAQAADPRGPHRRLVAARCSRSAASPSATPASRHEREARERLEHELRVIAEKDFAGYFVIVHDIVAFARERGILCQGRGSAASSAVCYALGITAVDAVFYRLPFERFISAHRDEEPDIDVDFDSDRREEVIQWVYDTYGRRNAAQVANVISLPAADGGARRRQGARLLAGTAGRLVQADRRLEVRGGRRQGDPAAHDVPAQVVALAEELMGAPRHLGIHSGGMVLTERPIGEVCPIERARMDRADGAAVGQGRVRVDGAGQVRPARPRACSARSTT